jgi:hypothetical protein
MRRAGRHAEAVVTGHTASREGTYPSLHPVVGWTDGHGTGHPGALQDGGVRDVAGRAAVVGAPAVVVLIRIATPLPTYRH